MKRRRCKILIAAILCMALVSGIWYVWNKEEQHRPTKVICILKVIDPTVGFWNAVQEGIKMASEEYDVKSDIRGGSSELDYEEQNRLIEQAIAEKPDVIVLSAVDEEKTLPAAKKIKENGIYLVLIDSGLKEHIEDAYIGTDNFKAGIRVGALIRQTIGEEGKAAVISFVKHSATAREREEGIRAAMGDDMERMAGIYYCDSNREKAYKLANKIIKKNPDLKLIVGLNQYASEGAAKAVKDMGMTSRIKMIGFDNSQQQIKYLEEGLYEGIVVQKSFNIGYLSIQGAVDLCKGRAVMKNFDPGSVMITKENMYMGTYQKLLFPFWEE